MTDRTRHLTVMLDGEYRLDDIEHLIKAIEMIKGVYKVEINVSNSSQWIAIEEAKRALRDKLWELLK
jgi:hypothetical protein